jgi:hypothetical protein
MAKAKKQKTSECDHPLVTLRYSVHQMNATKVGLRPAMMVCENCGAKITVKSPQGITLTVVGTEDAENSQAPE